MYDSFLWDGYKNASADIVRAAHPDWTNETQIEAQAAAEFNAAARKFYERTISFMREIRPKARLGFYGTPPSLHGTWWNATLPPTPTAALQERPGDAAPKCGPVNEGFCYLPDATRVSAHVVKTIGPPFTRYCNLQLNATFSWIFVLKMQRECGIDPDK